MGLDLTMNYMMLGEHRVHEQGALVVQCKHSKLHCPDKHVNYIHQLYKLQPKYTQQHFFCQQYEDGLNAQIKTLSVGACEKVTSAGSQFP
jgi:hypothetical protein